MGKKSLVFAAIFAAAAVLALLGGKLNDNVMVITGFAVGNAEEERHALMPADRITEDTLRTSDEGVLIKIANATIGRIEGTNSMRPLIGSESSAVMVRPHNAEDIKEGDIAAYESDDAAGLVLHRIVRTGSDEGGWFAITKGDNSRKEDPERVRFEQVRYVVVGILY